MREQRENLIYMHWIVLRHQSLTPLSVSNDLTELKDPVKHKHNSSATIEWPFRPFPLKPAVAKINSISGVRVNQNSNITARQRNNELELTIQKYCTSSTATFNPKGNSRTDVGPVRGFTSPSIPRCSLTSCRKG